jgi:hypothetical protein
MSQERIDMLKEMIEQSVNPAGWIGYYEGKIATFLFKQEDVPRFLENTDPVGSVVPVYTHPAKTLTDKEILLEAYYILMREQQRKAQENGDDTRSKG